MNGLTLQSNISMHLQTTERRKRKASKISTVNRFAFNSTYKPWNAIRNVVLPRSGIATLIVAARYAEGRRRDAHALDDIARVCGNAVIAVVSFEDATHGTSELGSIPDRVIPDFRMRESCQTMSLVCGFSRGSPVSPPFHSGIALFSHQSPSSAFKISLLRGAQISSLHFTKADITRYLLTYWLRNPIRNLPRKIGRVRIPNRYEIWPYKATNAMTTAVLAGITAAMVDAQYFTEHGSVYSTVQMREGSPGRSPLEGGETTRHCWRRTHQTENIALYYRSLKYRAVRLTSDLGSSFEPRWCNRAVDDVSSEQNHLHTFAQRQWTLPTRLTHFGNLRTVFSFVLISIIWLLRLRVTGAADREGAVRSAFSALGIRGNTGSQ
ncbi:hypothetical protein PR048_028520 [Dryococelus australis]|uniref:Uncharacterized protein n=1 Tax=Dryococelus australis TaxID=614101 RepID=A0ABQ9GAT5_9NEOP|nr:hypothetical protein PR048_028520 [Dryococelus australis]